MTRAAQRLGMQQPPLSQQIQALERALGVRLFHRLPRGVELTDAGRSFAARARLVVGEVEQAITAAQRTARGEQGRIAIGFTTPATFHPLVAGVVRAVRTAAPDVLLTLEENDTRGLIEAMRAERLDAAFVRTPEMVPTGLAVERLLDEEMFVAVPDGHRFAGRGAGASGVIRLGVLAEEPFVLPRRSSGAALHDGVVAACVRAGFMPRVAHEAPRMLSTLTLVAAGLGISIVPQSLARLGVAGVACVRLDGDAGLSLPLNLLYRDEAPQGVLALFLAEARRSAARARAA